MWRRGRGRGQPINVTLTLEEVAFVLNDCGGAAIFTAGDKAEVILSLTLVVLTLRWVISFDHADGDAVASRICLARRRGPGDSQAGTAGPVDDRRDLRDHRRSEGSDAVAPAVLLKIAALFAVQTRTDQYVMLNALPLAHVDGNIVMNRTLWPVRRR